MPAWDLQAQLQSLQRVPSRKGQESLPRVQWVPAWPAEARLQAVQWMSAWKTEERLPSVLRVLTREVVVQMPGLPWLVPTQKVEEQMPPVQ